MTAAPSKRPKPGRRIKRQRFDWRGITVSASFEADWLNSGKRNPAYATAHLEIEAIQPKRAKLPITETGYLSHFLAQGSVEEAGGPAAYVRAWLDEAASSKAWRRYELDSRQLSLF